MEHPIISPSKARHDAEQARDWAYVTSWLTKIYAPQPVPRFERNNDVLQSLLALVTANDTADGEAELLHRARREELDRQEETQKNVAVDPVQKLLSIIEVGLDDGKGLNALRDLAEASVLLGTLKTDATALGERMLEVKKAEFRAAGRLRGLGAMQAYLEKEVMLLESEMKWLNEQEDEGVTESLRQQTTQYNRDAKQVGMKLAEYKNRLSALERVKVAAPTLEDVKAEEKEVLALQARVKGLELRLSAYQGLPPDLEVAKQEYQRRQLELQGLTRRRDELFDRDLARPG